MEKGFYLNMEFDITAPDAPGGNDDNSFPTINHPLASISWPAIPAIWHKQITIADINEILDSMSIKDPLKDVIKEFAIKTIFSNKIQDGDNSIDEELLYARISDFLEGYVAAFKMDGTKG